ncbi:hypothetical protein ACFLTK_05890 [Chloroflexota bacterium]
METAVKETWKPTVAGILSIVAGGISLASSLVILGFAFFFPVYVTFSFKTIPEVNGVPLFGVIIVFTLILGILPIIGGVYALQRKLWGLALAGGIVAIIGQMPFGILSTIFIALAKDEFE